MKRRKFVKTATVSSAGLMIPEVLWPAIQRRQIKGKPATNIKDALKFPRNENSMPGLFPGRVIQVIHPDSVVNQKPVESVAYEMIEQAICQLTDQKNLKKAWRKLVNRNDRIGLKINPVAGPLLSTSHAVTQSVIQQLEESGITRKNIVIFDRREFQLHEIGYTSENYPGIRITGTECKDENGSFYDADGKLYSLERIDKKWFYWADCEMEYGKETMPFMVNSGKYSYFSKTVTQELDKIINIPILKNAGSSVTLCLKNLAYGVITNTSRLHQKLWSDTCAEVCAFPPLRDKVVLNIVDGLIGCYDKGPGANPQFITAYHTILAGTDPVAVDRVGYDIVIKKRIEEGVQSRDNPRGKAFINMAGKLNLGESNLDQINWKRIEMG